MSWWEVVGGGNSDVKGVHGEGEVSVGGGSMVSGGNSGVVGGGRWEVV